MPRRGAVRILLFAGALSGLSKAATAQFPWAGARALSMGGAQVAAVDDATAAWSNPAALAGLKGWTVQLFGGGVASDRNDAIGAVDSLSHLPFDQIASGQRLDLVPELLSDLDRLTSADTSVVFSGVAGLVVAYKGFALSAGVVPYAGVYPVVDLVHVVPGGGPDVGLAFNASGIDSVGLEAREVRLAYGYGLLSGRLQVGGAARVISGRTFFARCGVFDCAGKSLDDLVREAFHTNARDSTDFTFDLGARLDLGIVKVGVVGTSLTEPEFDVASVPGAPRSVKLPRQIRAGASVDALSFLTVAVDGDLVKSDTLAPNAQSREISLGAEVKIPLFAFRGGAMRDLAAADPHWAYTFGVGFNLPVISIEASGLISPKGGLNPTSSSREDLGGAASVRVHF